LNNEVLYEQDNFLVKSIRTFCFFILALEVSSLGNFVYISFELISSFQASLIFLLHISSAQDINKGPKNKPSILGTASLNLADYALMAGEIILPLSIPGGAPERASSLHVSIRCELEVLVNGCPSIFLGKKLLDHYTM
jgi:hypothetical protein